MIGILCSGITPQTSTKVLPQTEGFFQAKSHHNCEKCKEFKKKLE